MRELGERLRGYRLERGWSKRAVARLLGVSTPSIMRWEEGSAEPNDYNRHKIERLISDHVHREKASRSVTDLALFGRNTTTTSVKNGGT